jgi:CheY-like chemotaxis protein
MPGFPVTAGAGCGREETGAGALDSVVRKQPDLVLMDINLKGEMDGIEAARQIRKDFDIPVIFLTSHSDGNTLRRAKEIHPDGFITKPFSDDDLRVAIELALKK